MYPCRICLIKTDIQIHIFDIYQNKYDLQRIVHELCQIEVRSISSTIKAEVI